MKRHLLCIFLLFACAAKPDVGLYGRKYVAVNGCHEPFATWARDAIPQTDRMGGSEWHLADVVDAHDVEVRCTEALPAGVAGGYHPGDSYVLLNELVLHSENDVLAAVQHELTHWRVYTGPHPERVIMHVCRQVTLPHDPIECYSEAHGIAVMNATSSLGEDGDVTYVSEPTPADVEFTRWALTR